MYFCFMNGMIKYTEAKCFIWQTTW
jgi:hypothetical protein